MPNNQKNQTNHYALHIPYVMGLIGTRSFNTEMPGILDLVERAEGRIRNGMMGYEALQKLQWLERDSKDKQREEEDTRVAELTAAAEARVQEAERRIEALEAMMRLRGLEVRRVDRDEQAGELRQLLLDLGQQVALGAQWDLVDQGRGQGAVSLQRGDQGREHRADRVARRQADRRGHGRGEIAQDVLGAAHPELAHEVVLVAEVAVERPHADPGRGRDPVGAEPGVPPLGEDAGGRLQDAVHHGPRPVLARAESTGHRAARKRE